MLRKLLFFLLAIPLLCPAQITNSSFSNGSGSGNDGTFTLNTLLGSTGALASASPPPTVFTSDSLALVALYNSTFGPNWQNKTNWLTGPVNTWYGIAVQNSRVVEINLSGNSFRGGALPVEIGSLTALKKLGLAGFSLQGGLLTELGNLSALTWLDLNSNRFIGNIPASIGNLTALTNFDLRGCQLSGPLPAEIGNLTQLKTLMIGNNQLSGPLPSSFANLTLLETIQIDHNQFTGPFPSYISSFTDLTTISFDINQFTGTLPADIGNLTKLKYLMVSGNQLSGTIPASLGNLPDLIYLILSGNHLTGPIPSELSNLSKMSYFALDNNSLTGSIPPGMGNFHQANIINLSYNQLSGTIPEELSGLTTASTINLSNNQLTGSIPSSLSGAINLSSLNLSMNQLSGPIPGSLGNLNQLNSINLADNQLSGPIPVELTNLRAGSSINLSGNQLTGSLPDFPNYSNIQVSRNYIDLLPDFSSKPNLQVYAATNYLTFEDIEPNIAAYSFTYSPQRQVRGGGNQEVIIGSPLAIGFTIGGSANLYQWFKDNNPIAGATTNSYTVPAASLSDAGVYFLRITNTIVTQLTLETERITVTISGPPPTIITSDSLALVALYNSTNGFAWTNKTNWLTGPANTWHGVTASNLRVSVLNLSNNNLSGFLPAEIGDLTGLEQLYLSVGNFGGTLPPEIGNLTALQHFEAQSDNLISLPSTIGNLTNLTSLALGGNQIPSLPSTFSNLINLQFLDLAYNPLGTIPGEVFMLTSLSRLVAGHIQFSSLPNEIGNLTNLAYLDLNSNQLASIPASIGNLSRLKDLFIYNNQLSSIPNEIVQLGNLRTINASSNNLSSLPDFSRSRSIAELLVGSNYLDFGDIEPLIGRYSYLDYSNQKRVQPGNSLSIPEGVPLNISFTIGGSANQYQWSRDNTIIPGAISSAYSVAHASTAHAGEYYLRITSSAVPNLTLESELITVTILPPVDQDGDGYNSSMDCDDTDASIYPGHAEVCDGKDNNCDGAVDEGCHNPQLWGTATQGGPGGGGTIYGLDIFASTGINVKYSFTRDVLNPQASLLLLPDGSKVGIASSGGANSYGGIFRIEADGTERVVYSFNLDRPSGALVLGADGFVYGMTTPAGKVKGNATIFRINQDGSNHTLLHNFNGADGMNGELIQGEDGTLYGVSPTGGTFEYGIIFRIAVDGTGYAVLHEFDNTNGGYPEGALTQISDGTLYGTTYQGGQFTQGTVFKINSDGSGYTILHNFESAEGLGPVSKLVQAASGDFYGMTSQGGQLGYGTVFKITADGTGFSVLTSFDMATTGGYPGGSLLLGSDAFLYGMTAQGGTSRDAGGTIFKLNQDGSSYLTLFEFNGTIGLQPNGSLTQGTDGVLYGVAQIGGMSGSGTAFKINTDGSSPVALHNFSGVVHSSFGGLVQARSGAVYGMSISNAAKGPGKDPAPVEPKGKEPAGGKASDYGNIFRINSDGSGFTQLHIFRYDSGANPIGSLIQGIDGALYGMTPVGGLEGSGTLFRINEDGTGFTLLHQFIFAEGANPNGSLIQIANGKLFGMTQSGGSLYGGTIFSLDPDGSNYTVLHNFEIRTNTGAHPVGSLIQGLDGLLYGMTQSEGAFGGGTIFKINTDGTGYADLHSFNLNDEGGTPTGDLVQGLDGALYGMTQQFGKPSNGNSGTIFKIDADGTHYGILHSFDVLSGSNPNGSLTLYNDKLFGFTSAGGSNGGGVVFNYDLTARRFNKLIDFNAASGTKPAYGSLLLLNPSPPVEAPTVPAVNLAFSDVSASSMTITFQPGDGSRHAVFMAQNSGGAPNVFPIGDNTIFTGNPDFTLAPEYQGYKVVMAGTDTSVTVTHLSPDSQYSVLVIEYNQQGDESKYLVSPFLSGSQYTVPEAPTLPATNITFSNVFATQMNLAFTPGNGNRKLVVIKAGTPVDFIPMDDVSYQPGDAGNGNRIISNNPQSSFLITGLTGNTRYFATVYEFNERAPYRRYLTTGNPQASRLTLQAPDVYVTSPADNAGSQNVTLTVTAKALTGANVYTIELNDAADFTGTSFVKSGARSQSFTGLMYATHYFTRVKTNLSPDYGKSTSFTTSRPIVYVTTPADGSGNQTVTLNVTATAVTGANVYTIELNDAEDFRGNSFVKSGTRTQTFTGLAYATKYFTRVKTNNYPQFGQVTSFKTLRPDVFVTAPANGAVNQNTTVNVTSNALTGATVYTIELNDAADFSGTPIVKSGGRTQSFTGLAYAKKYYTRVKTDIFPQYGQITSFNTVVPNIFVTTPANGATNQNITLNVTSAALTGATLYTIELNESADFTGSGFVQTGARTQSFTGLAYNKEYFNRVKTDIYPVFGPINSFTTATAESFAYVTAPVNNAVNVNFNTNVTANLVPGATQYTIELNTAADFSGTSIVRSGTSRTHAFNLHGSVPYFSRVMTDLSPNWGPIRSFTTRSAAAVTYVTSPASNATNVLWDLNVTATNISGATSYTIELNDAADFTGTSFVQTGPTNRLHFTGLDFNTPYFSRVQTDLEPAWGPTRQFTTGTPLDYTFVTSPANGAVNVNLSVNVTANAVTSATAYTIELNTLPDFTGTSIVHSGTARTYTFSGLAPSKIYYSRVKTNLLPDDWGAIRSFATRTAASFAYVTSPANNAAGVLWNVDVTSNVVPTAVSYTIELNTLFDFSGTSFVQTGSSNRLHFNGLDYLTTYYTRVMTDVDLTWGATRQFTTASPVNYAYITSPVDGSTNVNWVTNITSNAVPSATFYTIEANTRADFFGTSIVKMGARTQSFTLAKDQLYFVRVKTELSPDWGITKSFTTGNALSLAYITSPVNGSTGVPTTVNVVANALTGATSYKIELNTAPDFSAVGIIRTSASRTISFTGLAASTTYYARVSTSLYTGFWGPTRSFTTADPAGRYSGDWRGEETDEEVSAEPIIVRTYPNPFVDRFEVHVQTADQQDLNATLTDMTGKVLFQSHDWMTNRSEAVAGEFSPGIYLLTLQTGSERQVVKVVKR